MSTRAWELLNRERRNAQARALYAKNAEKERRRQREYRRRNASRVNAYNARWSTGYRARLRSEFLSEYGGRCTCCGETEPLFLQIDHVLDDGAADRRAHKTAAKLLAHLKRSGWPKDRHRILCANCNHGRALNKGVCPHEARRAGAA